MSARTFRVGVDYGTSATKMVFRDYLAAGGEKAFVVLNDGSSRLCSTVGIAGEHLVFGHHPTLSGVVWLHSLKMRVAGEAKGCLDKFFYGEPTPLPKGFTSRELAALSVYHALCQANAYISTAYLADPQADIRLEMTMGIPTSFASDSALRAAFLEVAQLAFAMYQRGGGSVHSKVLSFRDARCLLNDARSRLKPDLPIPEISDWLRPEALAALVWPFQSPAVSAGPYVKLDVGAGTTNASLFRIADLPTRLTMGNGTRCLWVKERLVSFSAISVPMGMDAVGTALCQAKRGYDVLRIRTGEELALSSSTWTKDVQDAVSGIHNAYRRAWSAALPKLGTIFEKRAWREHRMFFVGGGSLVPSLRTQLTKSAVGADRPHASVPIEIPQDLFLKGNTKVASEDMTFLAIAYGLSVPVVALPEFDAPDSVSAAPGARVHRPGILDEEPNSYQFG